MPVPRLSRVIASVQVPVPADSSGITELRVHGVGGTPPDATLTDLAPEQVAGDSIAGFYRTSDHEAAAGGQDADRHVEVYSWGGLTSRSQTRVLWLVLLPFLFGNLAGWMCSAATRRSRWRFTLHRAASSLGALGLTVNMTLVVAMISVDLAGYQAVRAGRASRQWWLAPLSWHFVAGHPARQIAVATVPCLLLLMALLYLARRSSKYEATRPPYHGTVPPPPPSIPASAMPGGLANDDFWDGQVSVRVLTRLHIAAAVALLGIVLSVTAHALGGGTVLYWLAMVVEALSLGLVAVFACLDAALGGRARWFASTVLPALAAAGLVIAFVFAWRCPAPPANRSADLPGMNGVIGWTALGLGVTVLLVLVSALLGGFARGTLPAGSWVTLMLGFGSLNILLFAVQIWVAHLIGPVTTDAGQTAGKLYLPALITNGMPLLGWAAVVAAVLFAVVVIARLLLSRRLPAEVRADYEARAATFTRAQPPERRVWYGIAGPAWERSVARRRFIGSAAHSASLLLYGIVVLQIAVAIGTWRLHWQAPAVVRYVGTTVSALLVPSLMATLSAAWRDPVHRRTIGILWDVGTFWPRSYHPLSPPCYAERAIPDLQRRMWWLHDNGGKVLVAAHSQGAMLSVAALSQAGRRPGGLGVALATFGAPVIKLYGWGFPAYVYTDMLVPLASSGTGQLTGWRNFWYPTDPIGGPVGVSDVDVALPDPAESLQLFGQGPPHVGGHSGYWSDNRVWTVIGQLAALFTR